MQVEPLDAESAKAYIGRTVQKWFDQTGMTTGRIISVDATEQPFFYRIKYEDDDEEDTGWLYLKNDRKSVETCGQGYGMIRKPNELHPSTKQNGVISLEFSTQPLQRSSERMPVEEDLVPKVCACASSPVQFYLHGPDTEERPPARC